MTEQLKTKIYEGVGTASMCWSETPKGVFDDTLANEVAEKICVAVDQELSYWRMLAQTYETLNHLLSNSLKDESPKL